VDAGVRRAFSDSGLELPAVIHGDEVASQAVDEERGDAGQGDVGDSPGTLEDETTGPAMVTDPSSSEGAAEEGDDGLDEQPPEGDGEDSDPATEAGREPAHDGDAVESGSAADPGDEDGA
jgi:hypothetical protein